MSACGWPACRVIAPVVLAAAIATAAAGAADAGDETVFGGPSVLLSYLSGASPYTGIGRYEGRATCTAFFLDTGPIPLGTPDAPAYALTSGHCPGFPGPNDVLIGTTGIGRVVFNFFIDSDRWQLAVPVLRTAYATMKGQDVAVLELAASYRELTGQLIRPWPVTSSPPIIGEPIEIVGAPLSLDLSESFLRVARCRTEGVAPVVLEHIWHWFDAPFNRCRDVQPGSSGSPVISTIDRVVIGIVNTTTTGARPSSECALDHPCEPVIGGARARPETTYATSLAGIHACFDIRGRFTLAQAGCPLDPGGGPDAMPPYIGPVNPFLTTQPLGPVRRTWNVDVAATAPSYQYAIVSLPIKDCRTRHTYSRAFATAELPSIDAALPAVEGFAFLCVVGAADAWDHPTIVVARTDLTPPVLPAQVTITDTAESWRVRFSTVGHEVAFHVYKAGHPAGTRCDDPEGYRFAGDTLVGLPKASGPYRLCAIPYDAAQNPGRVFSQQLP